MRKSPKPLSALLSRLAAELGGGRLRRAALESGCRRALGPWLSARLVGCRRDGEALELELVGEEAAAQVRLLGAELLARLRAELGAGAPRGVRVRTARRPFVPPPPVPGGAGGRSPRPGPAALEALEAIDDPGLRERLARIAGRASVDAPASEG